MRLKSDSVNKDFWQDADIRVPNFDISEVKVQTETKPQWVHFGAGNIFRAFIARIYQELLNCDDVDTGLIVFETFDFEILDKIFRRYDNLSLVLLMDELGNYESSLVASIVEALGSDRDMDKMMAIFKNPSLQIVSFTITEKGYALRDQEGEYFPFVQRDLDDKPEESTHAMTILTFLLYERFIAGGYPLTILSLDNCSHNGDRIRESVIDITQRWLEKGYVNREFLSYVMDKKTISFPISMIDKITPRPSEAVKSRLQSMGIEDIDIVVTDKMSYSAAFVNSEVCEYLVIEDSFVNGRPPLEKVGVLFGDRDTVNKSEIMKVTTCLNPLHTALAIGGCLLGYQSIAEAMRDEELYELVHQIGYIEGLPVALNPEVLNPRDFIDEVVNKRLVNPNIPDTPERIATDTSQKIPIRYGITIDAYLHSAGSHKVSELVGIPLVIAAWLRYLLGLDDSLTPIVISPDPMLSYLQDKLKDIRIGDKAVNIEDIIRNRVIFGHDLSAIGLGDKVEKMFLHMIAGKNAFRDTLKHYLE